MKIAESELLIIGLGLMGGSLALGLKGRFRNIIGYDNDSDVLRIAKEQEIVDRVNQNLDEAVLNADVICLATPVDVIIELIEILPFLVPQGKEIVVFDLGSTKEEIVKKMSKLPPNFKAVGAHPICGKEKLGLRNADRTLYYGAPFIVSPTENTNENALSMILELIEILGAKQKVVDSKLHDEILGTISHIPFLLAGALVLTTPDSVKGYFGPGYRSASRLAATDARMMLPILLSNRENVLINLEKIVDELNLLVSILSANDKEVLSETLEKINDIYSKLNED